MPQAVGVNLLRGLETESFRSSLSPARAKLRDDAVGLARAGKLLGLAGYSYEVVALAQVNGGRLHAGVETLYAPKLLPQSGQLTALACAVATLGQALTDRVAELFAQRRAALAVALDSLGNELLFALARRVQDRILAETMRKHLTMAGELRPGDPGLGLDAQAAVLRLAQAQRIGVELTQGMLMRPHKSTSMVLGVGIDLPVTAWSRCDDCPSNTKCALCRPRPAQLPEPLPHQ
jgi:hypothetical protein